MILFHCNSAARHLGAVVYGLSFLFLVDILSNMAEAQFAEGIESHVTCDETYSMSGTFEEAERYRTNIGSRGEEKPLGRINQTITRVPSLTADILRDVVSRFFRLVSLNKSCEFV